MKNKLLTLLLIICSLHTYCISTENGDSTAEVVSGPIHLFVNGSLVNMTTGTVIGPQGSQDGIALLTSAHIFDPLLSPTFKKDGITSLTSDHIVNLLSSLAFETKFILSGDAYFVTQWIIHPEYEMESVKNDLAIGFLKKTIRLPLPFDWRVSVDICQRYLLRSQPCGLEISLTAQKWDVFCPTKPKENQSAYYSYNSTTHVLECPFETSSVLQVNSKSGGGPFIEFLSQNSMSESLRQGDSGGLWYLQSANTVQPMGISSGVDSPPELIQAMQMRKSRSLSHCDLNTEDYSISDVIDLPKVYSASNILTPLWPHFEWIETSLSLGFMMAKTHPLFIAMAHAIAKFMDDTLRDYRILYDINPIEDVIRSVTQDRYNSLPLSDPQNSRQNLKLLEQEVVKEAIRNSTKSTVNRFSQFFRKVAERIANNLNLEMQPNLPKDLMDKVETIFYAIVLNNLVRTQKEQAHDIRN